MQSVYYIYAVVTGMCQSRGVNNLVVVGGVRSNIFDNLDLLRFTRFVFRMKLTKDEVNSPPHPLSMYKISLLIPMRIRSINTQ